MSEHFDLKAPLYVFAGGGTGGHLAPGIAVAEQLRREQPDCRIRFVGSGRPVENLMLEPTGFEYVACETLPLAAIRRRPFRFLTSHCKAFRSAQRSIGTDRPAAVIGLGGFASVPFTLAAKRCQVPCVLLEQNTVPGKANRWLSRWHTTCLTFEESARYLHRKAVSHVTGNPLRKDIYQLAVADRSLPMEKPTLLVLGGSLGSRQVNDSVLNAVGQLATELAGWRIVHQTGPDGTETALAAYSQYAIAHEVAPFFADLPARLNETTLVVARAGATTLAELAAVGIPAVLVPYPAATDDHQTLNAELFDRAGAARIVIGNPPDFAPVDLVPVLKTLLTNKSELRNMRNAMRTLARPNAAADVVAILRSLMT